MKFLHLIAFYVLATVHFDIDRSSKGKDGETAFLYTEYSDHNALDHMCAKLSNRDAISAQKYYPGGRVSRFGMRSEDVGFW